LLDKFVSQRASVSRGGTVVRVTVHQAHISG
jgi:hypothetical protein